MERVGWPGNAGESMDGTRTNAKHRAGRLGLALTLLGCLASCRGLRAAGRTPYFLAIVAQNRHLEEQFQSRNLLGVADVYTDDAVVIDPQGARIAGREEIDAYWSAIESPVDWRIELRSIHGSDAVAYQTGISHLTCLRDGQRVTTVTEFLLLWRHEPDGWRIELDFAWPPEE